MDNPKQIITFTNGIERRYHNKSVKLGHFAEDDTFCIEIKSFDKEHANTPAVVHACQRGLIRVSHIKVNRQTLAGIAMSILEFLNDEGNSDTLCGEKWLNGDYNK